MNVVLARNKNTLDHPEFFSGEESSGQPETGPLVSILDLQRSFQPKKDPLLNSLSRRVTFAPCRESFLDIGHV